MRYIQSPRQAAINAADKLRQMGWNAPGKWSMRYAALVWG